MFYKNTINSNALGYLFWFYSGVVVALAGEVRRTLPALDSADDHPARIERATLHPDLSPGASLAGAPALTRRPKRGGPVAGKP
jgi:hypothetical protein